MQETELHDSSDDADYAVSIQHGSASVMMKSDNSKRSSSSEPEGAEVVDLKDNVAIHPIQFPSERISGRLKLIKQGSSLFMAWIPYKGQTSKARNLYTMRALPFTDVQSIHRHTPTLGWQFIIVVLSSGLAFPPLYFYNGGVKEFLATIKQHVFCEISSVLSRMHFNFFFRKLIFRSLEDENIFIVNDFQKPLQRTLSSLELPRAIPIASGPSTSTSAVESSSFENQGRDGGDVHNGSSSISRIAGRHRRKE